MMPSANVPICSKKEGLAKQKSEFRDLGWRWNHLNQSVQWELRLRKRQAAATKVDWHMLSPDTYLTALEAA